MVEVAGSRRRAEDRGQQAVGRTRVVTAFCLLPAACCLLPVIFFAPYLGGRIVPFGDDILLLNYPLLSLLAHALRAGHLVLWNPYSGGGYALAPFSALPFYPPSWLLAVLSVPAAMSWTYALDLMIGALGAYALAAQTGVSRGGRVIPAVVFPFSGFVLAHIFAGHYLEVGLICWLPATLAALHWAAAAPDLRGALRRGLLASGPLGMLILANGVSWLVFVDYPAGLVALALAIGGASRERRRGAGVALRAAARPLVALGGAGVVAALLGAVVLLPLRDGIGASVRGGAMSYHAATRVSEPMWGLVMALAPGLFGSEATHTYWFANTDAYYQEIYAYAGLLPLALAIVGVVQRRRFRHVTLYAFLAVLGVALALGAYTPLYAVLYRLVPGLDLARVPARWMLLAVLAVAVLAGAGADTLVASVYRRNGASRTTAVGARRRALVAALSSRPAPLAVAALLALTGLGVLGIALASALPQAAHHGTVTPALARLLIMAVISVIAALVAAQTLRPLGLALLLLVTVVDLWSANGLLVQPLDPAPYYRGAAVQLAHADAGSGRVWALDRSIPLRLGMLDRSTRDVQDFAPLTLADYWLFTHPGASLQGVDTGMARSVITRYNTRIADLLGVSLVVAPQPLHDAGLTPLAQVRVPRWGLLNGDWSHPGPHPGPAYAYRVTPSLPPALPVYASRTAQGRVPLAAVFAPAFDARRVALLDGPSSQPAASSAPAFWRALLQPAAGRPRALGPGVTLLGASENGLLLRAQMRRDGVLLLDQIYDPGWTVEVDGRAAAVRRADGVLTAVPLSRGTHRVSVVYAPSSFLLGAALTLLGYVIFLAVVLFSLWAKRRYAPSRWLSLQ